MGGDEAGGSYGGGSFSDPALSKSVLGVAAASGASFSFGDGAAVCRSQTVRAKVAATATRATRVTAVLEAEDMKPARTHLAAVRRVLWCTVTFPIC